MAIRVFQAAWAVAFAGGGLIWSVTGTPWDRVGGILAATGDLLPLGPHFLVNVLKCKGSFLLAAAVLLVADALGLKVLCWLSRPRPAGVLRLTAAFIGYAALSTFLFASSFVGLWFRPYLVCAGAGLLALLAPVLLRTVIEAAAAAARFWNDLPLFGKAVLVVLAAAWSPLLVLPETNIDCLTYHLTLPQQILERHRLFPAQIVAWAKPNPADQPHVFAVIFGLDPAARQVCFALAVLGAVALLKGVRIPVPALWGLLAVSVALLVPGYRTSLTVGKSDAIMAGFALAAAGALLTSGVFGGGRLRKPELAAAGFVLGAACAAKFLLLPLAGTLFLAALVRAPGGRRLRAALILLPGLVLPVLPWTAESWLYLADPLPPIASIAFPSLFGDPEANARARELFRHFVTLGNTRTLLAAPGEFARLIGADGFVFLAALPFIAWWRGGKLLTLVVAALAGGAVMVVGIRGALAHVERYTYPVYVILNLVGALAILDRYVAGRDTPGPASRRGRMETVVAAGVLLGLLSLTVGATVSPRWRDPDRTSRGAAFLAGRISTDEYRRKAMASFGAVLPELRRQVGARRGMAMLVIGEDFLYGIPARLTVSKDFRAPFAWQAANEAGTPERIAVKFRQAGFRWILYNPEQAGFDRNTPSPYAWTPPMLRRYVEFARRWTETAAASECERPGFGSTWLFAVRPRPAAPAVPFLPGADRMFHEATVAARHPNYHPAVPLLQSLYRLVPEVVAVRRSLGHALFWSGQYENAYWHLKAAVDAGVLGCVEPSLPDLYLAAGATGREEEARRLLRRARALYVSWPELAEKLAPEGRPAP